MFPLEIVSKWKKEKQQYIQQLQIYDFERMSDIKLFPNIKVIEFGCDYKQSLLPIEQGMFPDGLIYSEKGVFPNSLTQLTFGNKFNQRIEKGVLPDSLSNLTFGDNFDKQIEKGVLPDSLSSLTFGNNFNQIFKNRVFSNSLATIRFSNHTI
jgi:hypothetical protein